MKRFFISPKINFSLFIILAVVSIIGTFIPQIDVYHSWWFIGLLGFLSLNIIICALNRKGKIGYYIIHLSILIIFLGSIIGSLAGFKDYLNLAEQKVTPVPHTNFYIKLNKFWLEYYSDSQMIKDYKSNLTIIEDGREILSKTIEVNHPLNYKGIRFYQASYKIDKIKTVTISILGKDFRIGIGKEFRVHETNLKVNVEDFVPDFVMDEDEVFSKSDEPNNPAVLLAVYENGDLKYREWVFYKFPEFHHHNEKGIKFIFKDFHPIYSTGLQVVKDPGAGVVWIGCGLLMIGLISAFKVRLKKWTCPENRPKTEDRRPKTKDQKSRWSQVYSPLNIGGLGSCIPS